MALSLGCLVSIPGDAADLNTRPQGLSVDGQRWLLGSRSGNIYRLARPVGVTVGPDGALYFTSDSETEGLFRLSVTPSQPR